MPVPAVPSTPDELRREVAAVLGEPEDALGDGDDLLDAGLDSVRLMTLATRWSAAGVPVDVLALAEAPTLSAWWSHLAISASAGADA